MDFRARGFHMLSWGKRFRVRADRVFAARRVSEIGATVVLPYRTDHSSTVQKSFKQSKQITLHKGLFGGSRRFNSGRAHHRCLLQLRPVFRMTAFSPRNTVRQWD